MEVEIETRLPVPSVKPRVRNFAHRTKTGCSMCRRRRIKCDESRPSCKRCFMARIPCPGYIGDRSFPGDGGGKAVPIYMPQIGGSKDSFDLQYLTPMLLKKQGGNGLYMNQFIPYITSINMEFLPCRAGHNTALDNATSCVVRGIRELLSHSRRGKADTFFLAKPSLGLTRSYTTAVASLRLALDDRQQSATPEVLLAALLLCCFETLKENNKETVMWHMYGLTKIFELRGPSGIRCDVQPDKNLLLSCITLSIEACYARNSPCFWSQKQWRDVIDRLRPHVNPERRERSLWFLDIWSLHARATTILAYASELILSTAYAPSEVKDRRRILLRQIDRLYKTTVKLCDDRVQEVAENDPAANIYSVYEKLGETTEGRLSYHINYLAVYAKDDIICGMLQSALGGEGAVAAAERAISLAEWMDAFRNKLPSEETCFSEQTQEILRSTVEIADEWRAFAAETEAGAKQGRTQAIDPELFRRWLTMSGITPRM